MHPQQQRGGYGYGGYGGYAYGYASPALGGDGSSEGSLSPEISPAVSRTASPVGSPVAGSRSLEQQHVVAFERAQQARQLTRRLTLERHKDIPSLLSPF